MRTIVLITAMLLGGCTGWVSTEQYERAKVVCEPRGGIQYVDGYILDSGTFTAYCKDGSKIIALTKPR